MPKKAINILLNYLQKGRLEAGCDEAGRGCLAGPVYAAAVILPEDFYHPELDDSKKVKESVREVLRKYIEENAICYAVAYADSREIDRLNILRASILSMQRALDKLTVRPDFILVDGNKFAPYKDIPYSCVVKGDAKFASIAAASILAKTYRDDYMNKIAEECPEYDWTENKGYPTQKHRDAIEKYGLTQYHRKTFANSSVKQLTLPFEEN